MAGNEERYTPEQVAAALRECKGLQYLAARRLGCHANTILNYLDRYPYLRAVIADQKGHRLDNAESKLDEAIERGEPWAICFFLKTQGKARGFVERTQLAGVTEEPIHVEHGGTLTVAHQPVAADALAGFLADVAPLGLGRLPGDGSQEPVDTPPAAPPTTAVPAPHPDG